MSEKTKECSIFAKILRKGGGVEEQRLHLRNCEKCKALLKQVEALLKHRALPSSLVQQMARRLDEEIVE